MTRTRSLADRARDPSLSGDTTPELGGNLDVNGNAIVSTSNGNIAITPHGSGQVVLDGLSWPTSDGSSNQLLKTDGSGSLSFATVNSDVVSDTTPQLGGSLDVNGNAIVSASNGNISITPNGSGKVIIDGLSHPTSDGSSGQFLKTDGSGSLSFDTVNTDLSSDSTPQLGGNLDVNGNSIVSASNGNIAITPNGSGKIILDGLSFPTADGSADTVLKTDGAGNLAFSSVSALSNSGITQVQDDTSPTLGGTLDANGNSIDMGTNTLTDTNLGQFITAHGWGNHASAGYLTSHPSISGASSSNNSGRTYIQDITLDGNGHVTGIATATETVTDTNTTYSGGTNISLSGTTFNLDNNITLSGTAQATRYYIDGTSRYIDSASGNYGTIRVEGGAGAYEGYALRDDFVFMSGSTANCGIYNDIDNEWMILCYRNDQVQLRHNGTETFRTDVQGIHVRSSSAASDGAIFLGTNAHAHIYNDENTAIYMRNGANENIIYGAENSHTYIYYDASWRIRTNSNGIQVRDSNNADGRIAFGSNEHAKIYNDEGTAISITTGANEYFIYANENSYTYLYYNGTWKARARSDGFEVSGSLVVSDKISVNNSYGVSGQVLTSRGSGSTAQWQDAGGGAWEVIGNYTGNATGTNATVDFVHGSGGFVHDATTYKHMKMYAQLWQNNGATGSSYLNVFPLVGTTSSYAPMSNLAARHSAFQLIHPEFTGVTYNHTKWGYGAQSFSNNQGAVATNIRLHRSSTTATSVGMGMFSESINGTTYSSGDRFYPTAVEMDFPCKGIDPMFGFMGHIYYRFDTGLFDNYTYYNRWMMMGDGYGKVGWRITSSTNNVPFNYDITWIGLKP